MPLRPTAQRECWRGRWPFFLKDQGCLGDRFVCGRDNLTNKKEGGHKAPWYEWKAFWRIAATHGRIEEINTKHHFESLSLCSLYLLEFFPF
jgi:hypothetical protein